MLPDYERLIFEYVGGEMEANSENRIGLADYRILMVIENSNYLNRLESNQYSIFTQKFHHSVSKTIKQFNGTVINEDNSSYLVSFDSATDAVLCALQIDQKFKYVTPRFDKGNRQLKIGIAAARTDQSEAVHYDEAIIQATQMCEVVKDTLVISPSVKKLYERENRNAKIDSNHVRVLKPRELQFLNRLMNASQQIWNQGNLNLHHLRSAIGCSRSAFYRRLMGLTGKSPQYFVREFRLYRALNLLRKRQGNISRVANAAGFKNASHFAKCFTEKFGMLPSKYTQHHAV